MTTNSLFSLGSLSLSRAPLGPLMCAIPEAKVVRDAEAIFDNLFIYLYSSVFSPAYHVRNKLVLIRIR